MSDVTGKTEFSHGNPAATLAAYKEQMAEDYTQEVERIVALGHEDAIRLIQYQVFNMAQMLHSMASALDQIAGAVLQSGGIDTFNDEEDDAEKVRH